MKPSLAALCVCFAALAVSACGGQTTGNAASPAGEASAPAGDGAQPSSNAAPAAAASIDPSAPMTGPNLMARVQQAYTSLKSYSDTGSIATVQALPGVPDPLKANHTFSTKFTGPRQFKFDFRGGQGDHLVIWSTGGPFTTWWKATGVTQEYPQGEGATAFATSQQPTSGGAIMIATLLFPGASLAGPLAGMDNPELLEPDTLNGRKMYRLKADVRLNHWSDTTRPTTVWIDQETLLVHKVLEDRPSNTDMTDTITTVLSPQANIDIPASEFQFTPPKS